MDHSEHALSKTVTQFYIFYVLTWNWDKSRWDLRKTTCGFVKDSQLYLQYRLPRKTWLVWPINVINATAMFVNHSWRFTIVSPWPSEPDVWSHVDGQATKVLLFHKDKFWPRFGLYFLFSLSFSDLTVYNPSDLMSFAGWYTLGNVIKTGF